MAKETGLEFFDNDGRKSTLGKNELQFFSYMVMSLEKIAYSIFIVKTLIMRSAPMGFYLMALGFVRSLRGITPQLNPAEYLQLCREIIGFVPVKVRRLEDGIEMRLSPDGYFISGIVQVFYLDQYHLAGRDLTGKTIIDAGANQGFFSIFAAKMGARKVYAFEPVKSTFAMLKRNIQTNGLERIIIPLNMALGEKNFETVIAYDYAGDGEASLVFRKSKTKMQKVKVRRMDDFVKGERVDFIKIDAEGYESEILKGAEKTIRKHRPVLAFSAYHKPGDKANLPKLVKSIRNDYSCHLETRCEDDIICE